MPDDLDLTSELDAAEEIVMGRAESVVTEWGVRTPAVIWIADDREEDARNLAARYGPGSLVRRTVTYGPWEEVPR